MIEIWNGQTDLRPLAESWSKECDGDFDIEQGMRDLTSLRECVNSDVFVLYNRGEDEPIGVMGIQILDMFFTKDAYSAVRYWYVLPDYRAMAHKLIRFAKNWSKEMACKKMLICSNRLCHPADEFYLVMGFREFETVYIGDL